LVYNEVRKKSFRTLIYMIYDYKRAKAGEVGITYWKATGAKTRAQVEVNIYSTTHMPLLPAATLLGLPLALETHWGARAVLSIASSAAGTKRTRSCSPTALPSPRQADNFPFLLLSSFL
jgi:hypothetical protein